METGIDVVGVLIGPAVVLLEFVVFITEEEFPPMVVGEMVVSIGIMPKIFEPLLGANGTPITRVVGGTEVLLEAVEELLVVALVMLGIEV